MSNQPKISIVTVVFNAKEQIAATINSVLAQKFDDYEYIVVDGKSTDGTSEIIKTFENHIAVYINEKDEGIYDAMNKGTSVAKGEWIYFLNSGDCFYDENVLSALFKDSHTASIVYGNNEADYGYFKRINTPLRIERLKHGMIFSHQAMITKTALLKATPFDTKYKLSADYNFIYRLFNNGYNFEQIDLTFATVESGGVSEKLIVKTHQERKEIALSYETGKAYYKLKKWYEKETRRLKFRALAKVVLPKKIVQKITIKKYQ